MIKNQKMKSRAISLAFVFGMMLVPKMAFATLPKAPTDPSHPGSLVYSYGVKETSTTCLGRATKVFLPESATPGDRYPMVAFGHGQALDVENYRATLEHLAKKGVAASFIPFDTGFFDRDWNRMGSDFAKIASCVAAQFSATIDETKIIYSGHSKGAYVAQVAMGLAPSLVAGSAPKAAVLFAPAGSDRRALVTTDPNTTLTVVFSDKDTVVDQRLSEEIFQLSASTNKQFILLKSYNSTSPRLSADHFWPVTKSSFAGGGPVSAFHYHSSWKWLVGAASDLSNASPLSDPYVYGPMTTDKGIAGEFDDVKRTW